MTYVFLLREKEQFSERRRIRTFKIKHSKSNGVSHDNTRAEPNKSSSVGNAGMAKVASNTDNLGVSNSKYST